MLADRPEHSASSPLSIHAMTVAYNRKPVLWDVDLDIPAGTLSAIVGPNGAGKSTLIKACLGLVPRAAGRVEFWGQSYDTARHRIGYVPQRESVDWDFPVSALDVVCMGMYGKIGWFRRVRKSHKEHGQRCLDRVGMGAFAKRQISQLSGGQQQRVFLARALAQESDLYFMDEPFAGVDAATERAIIEVLREIRSSGRTVLCVHHDLQTVPTYFDIAVLMNMRVVAAGPVDEVFTEENLRKTYGGRLTLLAEASEAVARLGGAR
ncbi:MAG: metal ABC transporter ATP-binding protein [Phycisphaeraceae bacterium]|nr:metal ABC transporter ATP-binding protein [Phycisphaerales bacterium]MCB9860571.1 metal ABC transporter ATP-binding protein [Phycisphaeraceae bacterium]